MNNQQSRNYHYDNRDSRGRRIMNEHIRRSNPFESSSNGGASGSSHRESSATCGYQKAERASRMEQFTGNYSQNTHTTQPYQVTPSHKHFGLPQSRTNSRCLINDDQQNTKERRHIERQYTPTDDILESNMQRTNTSRSKQMRSWPREESLNSHKSHQTSRTRLPSLRISSGHRYRENSRSRSTSKSYDSKTGSKSSRSQSSSRFKQRRSRSKEETFNSDNYSYESQQASRTRLLSPQISSGYRYRDNSRSRSTSKSYEASTESKSQEIRCLSGDFRNEELNRKSLSSCSKTSNTSLKRSLTPQTDKFYKHKKKKATKEVNEDDKTEEFKETEKRSDEFSPSLSRSPSPAETISNSNCSTPENLVDEDIVLDTWNPEDESQTHECEVIYINKKQEFGLLKLINNNNKHEYCIFAIDSSEDCFGLGTTISVNFWVEPELDNVHYMADISNKPNQILPIMKDELKDIARNFDFAKLELENLPKKYAFEVISIDDSSESISEQDNKKKISDKCSTSSDIEIIEYNHDFNLCKGKVKGYIDEINGTVDFITDEGKQQKAVFHFNQVWCRSSDGNIILARGIYSSSKLQEIIKEDSEVECYIRKLDACQRFEFQVVSLCLTGCPKPDKKESFVLIEELDYSMSTLENSDDFSADCNDPLPNSKVCCGKIIDYVTNEMGLIEKDGNDKEVAIFHFDETWKNGNHLVGGICLLWQYLPIGTNVRFCCRQIPTLKNSKIKYQAFFVTKWEDLSIEKILEEFSGIEQKIKLYNKLETKFDIWKSVSQLDLPSSDLYFPYVHLVLNGLPDGSKATISDSTVPSTVLIKMEYSFCSAITILAAIDDIYDTEGLKLSSSVKPADIVGKQVNVRARSICKHILPHEIAIYAKENPTLPVLQAVTVQILDSDKAFHSKIPKPVMLKKKPSSFGAAHKSYYSMNLILRSELDVKLKYYLDYMRLGIPDDFTMMTKSLEYNIEMMIRKIDTNNSDRCIFGDQDYQPPCLDLDNGILSNDEFDRECKPLVLIKQGLYSYGAIVQICDTDSEGNILKLYGYGYVDINKVITFNDLKVFSLDRFMPVYSQVKFKACFKGLSNFPVAYHCTCIWIEEDQLKANAVLPKEIHIDYEKSLLDLTSFINKCVPKETESAASTSKIIQTKEDDQFLTQTLMVKQEKDDFLNIKLQISEDVVGYIVTIINESYALAVVKSENECVQKECKVLFDKYMVFNYEEDYWKQGTYVKLRYAKNEELMDQDYFMAAGVVIGESIKAVLHHELPKKIDDIKIVKDIGKEKVEHYKIVYRKYKKLMLNNEAKVLWTQKVIIPEFVKHEAGVIIKHTEDCTVIKFAISNTNCFAIFKECCIIDKQKRNEYKIGSVVYFHAVKASSFSESNVYIVLKVYLEPQKKQKKTFDGLVKPGKWVEDFKSSDKYIDLDEKTETLKIHDSSKLLQCKHKAIEVSVIETVQDKVAETLSLVKLEIANGTDLYGLLVTDSVPRSSVNIEVDALLLREDSHVKYLLIPSKKESEICYNTIDKKLLKIFDNEFHKIEAVLYISSINDDHDVSSQSINREAKRMVLAYISQIDHLVEGGDAAKAMAPFSISRIKESSQTEIDLETILFFLLLLDLKLQTVQPHENSSPESFSHRWTKIRERGIIFNGLAQILDTNLHEEFYERSVQLIWNNHIKVDDEIYGNKDWNQKLVEAVLQYSVEDDFNLKELIKSIKSNFKDAKVDYLENKLIFLTEMSMTRGRFFVEEERNQLEKVVRRMIPTILSLQEELVTGEKKIMTDEEKQ